MNLLFQWMRRHGEHNLRPGLSRHHQRDMVCEKDGDHQLNMPGLYGRHGILPDYFSDELLKVAEDHAAMRDFLDLFNGRYYHMLFATWSKYRFLQENALDKDDSDEGDAFYLNRLAGMLGQRQMPTYQKGLRWNKLALFRKRARTREGLYAMVRAFFPDLELELETFVAVERIIPSSQRPKLGKGLRLGEQGNLLTGKTIMDPCGGIRLSFKSLNYEAYMNLLPGGSWREPLATLVGDFTRNERDCMVSLELRADQVPAWRLGDRGSSRDMWLLSGAAPASVRVEAGRL